MTKANMSLAFFFFFQDLPSEGNGNNPSFVLCNLQESRLSQIKVLQWRVAPATIVIRQSIVRGAEVCGSNNDASREAPSGVLITSHLIARPTTQTIVEQSCAECCSVSPIALAVQIAITTSPSCNNNNNNNVMRNTYTTQMIISLTCNNRRENGCNGQMRVTF